MQVTVEDHKSRARDKAKDSLKECQDRLQKSSLSAQEQLDLLASCMEEKLAESMKQTSEEIQFQSGIRKQMGQAWADYACQDATNVTTTIAIKNETWAYRSFGSGKRHTLNTLFESDYSSIVRAQEFLTSSECQALESATAPGKSAPMVLPLSARDTSSTIANIVAKVEKFVSEMSGMTANMRKDPLLEFHLWQGNNDVDASKDCTIAADGSTTCENTAAASASPPERIDMTGPTVVASLWLICQAPEEGGQIYFPKTGTIILPREFLGSAILMLHEKGGEREDDPFIDEMVVCPVTKGKLSAFAEDLTK